MNSKTFEPRPGGWARLSAKLSEYDREQIREALLWRGAAVAMLALIVVAANVKTTRVPVLEEKIETTPTITVPGMPQNVHYYWVVGS